MALRLVIVIAGLVALACSFEDVPELGDGGLSEQAFGRYFIGDMRLSSMQMDTLQRNEAPGPFRVLRRRRRHVATNLWPNAVIPYKIDCSLENMPKAISIIKAAMAEWEGKTCIRFKEYSNERAYLTFFRGRSCWGDVGRFDGESKISLGPQCDFQYVMAHELGHAIGFYHEQNRVDRDKYIKIQWDNIQESRKKEFKKSKKHKPKAKQLKGDAYDIASIMHYSWKAFSKNGNKTIKPLRPTKSQPYQSVSTNDALQANRMYNCHSKNKRSRRSFRDCEDKVSSCKNWARAGYCSSSTYVSSYCKRSCKAPECDSSVECTDKRKECKSWAKWGHCRKSRAVMKLCLRSCHPKCKQVRFSLARQSTTSRPATATTVSPNITYKKRKKTPGMCIDKRKNCRQWAKWGLCKRSKTFLTLCTKSCHPECKTVRCFDKRVQCSAWMKKGYCKLSGAIMQLCQKSCNPKCKEAIECIDRRSKCRRWKSWGHCKINKSLLKLCTKSCHPMCNKDTIEATETPKTKAQKKVKEFKCVDKRSKCKKWKSWGHCKINKSLLKLCTKSCHPKCKKEVKCIDKNPQCETWKSWGHCQINKSLMKSCAKTCHPKCQEEHTVHSKKKAIKMGIGILCTDSNKECPKYAKEGRCKTDKRWMEEYCKLSCKLKDCDAKPQKPSGPCSSPLGIGFDGKRWKIPDSSLSASSEHKAGKWSAGAKNARLYFEDDHEKKLVGAWCSKTWNITEKPFLEVDLGKEKKIKYIATQGRHKFYERVSKFRVQFSNDRNSWQDYTEDGKVTEFEGNCDHFTPILNTFSNTIKARHFRYYPTEANFPCVRMELFGC